MTKYKVKVCYVNQEENNPKEDFEWKTKEEAYAYAIALIEHEREMASLLDDSQRNSLMIYTDDKNKIVTLNKMYLGEDTQYYETIMTCCVQKIK